MSGTGVLIYKLSHLCYVSRISLRIGKLDSTVPKVLKMPQQWVNELFPRSFGDLPADRFQTPVCARPKPGWIFCPVFVSERLKKEKKREGDFSGGLGPLFQSRTARNFFIGFAFLGRINKSRFLS